MQFPRSRVRRMGVQSRRDFLPRRCDGEGNFSTFLEFHNLSTGFSQFLLLSLGFDTVTCTCGFESSYSIQAAPHWLRLGRRPGATKRRGKPARRRGRKDLTGGEPPNESIRQQRGPRPVELVGSLPERHGGGDVARRPKRTGDWSFSSHAGIGSVPDFASRADSGPSRGDFGHRRFTSLRPGAHQAEQGMRRASSPFLLVTRLSLRPCCRFGTRPDGRPGGRNFVGTDELRVRLFRGRRHECREVVWQLRTAWRAAT